MDCRIIKYEDYRHGEFKHHYHDMNLNDLALYKKYSSYVGACLPYVDSIKTFETDILPKITIHRDDLPIVYDRAQQIRGYRTLDPRLTYCHRMWAWSLPLKDSWYLLTPFKKWLE